MNARDEVVAYWQFLEVRGLKPSIEKCLRHIREHGLKLRKSSAVAAIRELRGNVPESEPEPKSGHAGTDREPTGNVPRARSRHAPGIETISRNPLPGIETPDTPDGRIRVKDGAAFGADEAIAAAMIAAESSTRKTGKISPSVVTALRARLLQLRDEYGVELWRHACTIAAAKPAGVNYAAAVMRGERNRNGAATIVLPLARAPTRGGANGAFLHFSSERSEAEVLAGIGDDE